MGKLSGKVAVITGGNSSIGLTTEQAASFSEGVKGQIPLGRFGRPAEVARAALFLASSDSSFILGEEIVIDGGLSRL